MQESTSMKIMGMKEDLDVSTCNSYVWSLDSDLHFSSSIGKGNKK